MEPPTLRLRCSNKACPVRPRTPGEETARYETGKGYVPQEEKVREEQLARWNTRYR